MIDAHTHLYSDKYRRDLDQVIRRAQKKLEAVIISAVDRASLAESLDIQRRYPDFIYVTGGIHPRKALALKKQDRLDLWRAVENARNQIVAVGEVGPDFFHTKNARDQQRQLDLLAEALVRAESWRLPLVVHARKAENAALEVLAHSRTAVMFHCFAGSKQVAEKITDRGFYLSLSAILLFNSDLQETVTSVPIERILIETDCPALSPRRGHGRNEPAFLETILWRLAELLDCSPQRAAEITAENTRKFYGLPATRKPKTRLRTQPNAC